MCPLTSLTCPWATLQRQSPNLCPAVVQLYLSYTEKAHYTEKAQSACLVSLGTFAAHQSFEAPDPQATLPISLFLSRRRRQPLHYNS